MQFSPLHWILGHFKYGRAWVRYHEWYPDCRVLFKRLETLSQREAGEELPTPGD